MKEIHENNGAIFSECRKYRYALWRIWDKSKPMVMFIGLNPSTANENKDDATIRRVRTIASTLGYGGVYMTNCFPYISTDPKQLNEFGNTATNDHWLLLVKDICHDVIFAWGNFKIVSESGRNKELIEMFPNAKALHINKNGSPKHPLYCPSDIQPVVFTSLTPHTQPNQL
ncbi:MAG TPA: DUF1643 domain-containing protein [Bacteroidia bacterium]|jgi:hypothetical protein|nr:DUF1643 domain-containing protein [Bacteroidia bacterium]